MYRGARGEEQEDEVLDIRIFFFFEKSFNKKTRGSRSSSSPICRVVLVAGRAHYNYYTMLGEAEEKTKTNRQMYVLLRIFFIIIFASLYITPSYKKYCWTS